MTKRAGKSAPKPEAVEEPSRIEVLNRSRSPLTVDGGVLRPLSEGNILDTEHNRSLIADGILARVNPSNDDNKESSDGA